MANSDTETLLRAAGAAGFARELAQVLAESVRELAPSPSGTSTVLAIEIEQLRSTSVKQTDAVVENTQAVLQNTVAQALGGRASTASGMGKVALGIMTAGLSPLITGLVRAFTGGGSPAPEPLPTYFSKPQAWQIEGRITGQQRGVEWSLPDGFEPAPAARATAAPQITVQVQAIDSRSFLDHRDEIARAVRQAVLNSNSLNDVLNEL